MENRLLIDANGKQNELNDLFGIFFEDLNHAADGGYGSRSGAGDGGEKHTDYNGYQCQAAGDSAKNFVENIQ